jgi:hypothetical protein
MKREEAVDFIVQELGKHHSRNEIITALCQQVGMNWSQAEQFLLQVEAEHSHAIASRQSPLLIVMGVTFIIVGCGLLIYNTEFFLGLFDKDALGLALSAQSAYYRIGSIILGLGMLIGGIIGVWRVVSETLGKQG